MNPGKASVFLDGEQLRSFEKRIAEEGCLEGHQMAEIFNMIRDNDMIWSFVANNYLLGRDPMPFDPLNRNAHSIRLS